MIDGSIGWSKEDFIRVLYGTRAIRVPMNRHDGSIGEPREEFIPNGAFMRSRDEKGMPLKPDGLPAHRRISSVICVNEFCEVGATELTSDERHVDNAVLVFHNPYPYHRLPVDFGKCYREFRLYGEKMAWTTP
jgi:hypothetical protein